MMRDVTRPSLPDFTVDAYRELLRQIRAAGYALAPVNQMPAWDGERVVYLRHDVDVHIPGIERLAAVEAELGGSATYFIPLTLHFNPAYPPNRDILRGLVAEGHEIGLHYDLQTYPWELDAAWRHLDAEVAALARLVDAPVTSICMHNPWIGREDVFARGGRYVHPHDPDRFGGIAYVSDSCRAWRDESLLELFGEPGPDRLLLNTHPELWLGADGEERFPFLENTLLRNAVAQHAAYVPDQVRHVWLQHPAPGLDDARRAAAASRR
jgi:hypothetical protein